MAKKKKDPAYPTDVFPDVQMDPVTGTYHMPIREDQMVKTIRGGHKLFYNPKMDREYSDPVMATFGGRDYVRDIPRWIGTPKMVGNTYVRKPRLPAAPEHYGLGGTRQAAHAEKQKAAYSLQEELRSLQELEKMEEARRLRIQAEIDAAAKDDDAPAAPARDEDQPTEDEDETTPAQRAAEIRRERKRRGYPERVFTERARRWWQIFKEENPEWP